MLKDAMFTNLVLSLDDSLILNHPYFTKGYSIDCNFSSALLQTKMETISAHSAEDRKRCLLGGVLLHSFLRLHNPIDYESNTDGRYKTLSTMIKKLQGYNVKYVQAGLPMAVKPLASLCCSNCLNVFSIQGNVSFQVVPACMDCATNIRAMKTDNGTKMLEHPNHSLLLSINTEDAIWLMAKLELLATYNNNEQAVHDSHVLLLLDYIVEWTDTLSLTTEVVLEEGEAVLNMDTLSLSMDAELEVTVPDVSTNPFGATPVHTPMQAHTLETNPFTLDAGI